MKRTCLIRTRLVVNSMHWVDPFNMAANDFILSTTKARPSLYFEMGDLSPFKDPIQHSNNRWPGQSKAYNHSCKDFVKITSLLSESSTIKDEYCVNLFKRLLWMHFWRLAWYAVLHSQYYCVLGLFNGFSKANWVSMNRAKSPVWICSCFCSVCRKNRLGSWEF